MNRFEKAVRVLLGKELPIRVTYHFSSRMEISKLPKNKLIFVTCEIVVDEGGKYWLEKVDMFAPRNKKSTKYFAGSIDEISIYNRVLTNEEVEQIMRGMV